MKNVHFILSPTIWTKNRIESSVIWTLESSEPVEASFEPVESATHVYREVSGAAVQITVLTVQITSVQNVAEKHGCTKFL